MRVPRRRAAALMSVAIALCATALASDAAAQTATPTPGLLEVQTVPPLTGVVFSLDGHSLTSDAQGVARIQVSQWAGVRDRLTAADLDLSMGVRAKFTSWYGDPEKPPHKIEAAFDTYYLVTPAFVDSAGIAVAIDRISSLGLRSSHGVSYEFHDAQPHWLKGARVIGSTGELTVQELSYSVESVVVQESNVVIRGQQVFFPSRMRNVEIRLLFDSTQVPSDIQAQGQAAAAALPPKKAADPSVLEIQTVPPLPGITFSLDGRTVTSDTQGTARIQVDQTAGLQDRIVVPDADLSEGVRVKFVRWYGDPTNPSRKRLVATLDVYYLVNPTFVDLEGNPVAPDRVTSLVLKSSHGVSHTLDEMQPQWLQGTRVVPLNKGLFVKDLYYSVESVTVDGSDVVNRAQQTFFPGRTSEAQIQLLFYSARFRARDALFRFPIGSGISLQYPDNHTEHPKFDSNGEVTLQSLPRGEYQVSVDGPGLALTRPVALSRNQDVSLDVISYLDIAVVGLLAGAIGLGLVLIPRGFLRRRRHSKTGVAYELARPSTSSSRDGKRL